MNIQELTNALYDIKAVQFGSFKLKSGIMSPIYLDLRLLVSHPKLLQNVAELMWNCVKDSSFDLVCGVPYTAMPIATCLSVAHNVPMVMRRKEVKDHGTRKIIEGIFEKGQTCLVMEDCITSGASVLETTAPLQAEGLLVKDVVVLVDREQGGKENLENKGYRVHAPLSLRGILEMLHAGNKINLATYETVLTYLGQGVVHAS